MGVGMKAFLWAVVACVGISLGAGFVLTGKNASQHPSRTVDSVRLN